jgi:hypothetical protein
MEELYDRVKLNETIHLIKRGLVFQLKKNKYERVGPALEKIRGSPSIKKKGEYADKAVEILKLNEFSKTKIRDYLTEGYLRKNGVKF